MMNQHTLRITAHNQPTVLERLLQVTRYRGFSVTGMTMFPSNESNLLDIELSVSSEHSIDQLNHQLAKLFDINDVVITDNSSQQCSA
jgi:acetolactate synthase II small subunit